MKKIRINYKEGGFSLIWFDKELQRLQMMTAIAVYILGKVLEKQFWILKNKKKAKI